MNVIFDKSINNYPLKSQRDNSRANYMYSQKRQPAFGSLETMAESFANRLIASKTVKKELTSKHFNKFLKSAIENPGMFEALIALLITCTARPLTILFTPGAKMEDKQYASAQSIASGITTLIFAHALFEPIRNSLDNILISINGENVKNTFVQFYNDPKNKKLIGKLVERKVIPSPEEFKKELDGGNIFGYLKKYIAKGEGHDKINQILLGDNTAEQKQWSDLAKNYSDKLKDIFEKNRFNGIEKKHHFLVHESLEFMNNGAYKLKTSAGADKTKYLVNFSSKIILFPLTAGIMIWSIPKIMRVLFPNHKKSKAKGKNQNTKSMSLADTKQNMQSASKNTVSANVAQSTTYEQFKKKPAIPQKQVSFSGLGKSLQDIYDKCYSKPVSAAFEKLFRKITLSDAYSKKINTLLEDATSKQYQWVVPTRDKTGKILKKADANAYISNLPNIAAIFGSCLYIINTIRNKEIEPERKPALCTNMAVVAVFSLFASKYIERISTPIFDTLKKFHSGLIGNKLNYDHDEAWKCASKMLTTTFAFRYLGPVLATPAADKIVKLFNKNQETNK